MTRELLGGSQWGSFERFTGTLENTFSTTAELEEGLLCIAFAGAGTVLLRGADSARWSIFPPHSVCLVRGPARFALRVARGPHDVNSISWHRSAGAWLAGWIDENWPRTPGSESPALVTQPINPVFEPAYDRFKRALKRSDPVQGPLISSVIHECVGYLVAGRSSLGLAPIPLDMPDTLAPLVMLVRERPFDSWSLKEASDQVGYSPFHFSRVFKALVGYGFHEFVDRCRTEFAVAQILESDASIDMIATNAGFGTTQGLRESIREYLGLVPSELRREPESDG